MNFSKEWEQRYKENTHLSIWPWSDLVSYVMRYSRPHNNSFRVLELGCGAGANIPFFMSLGVEYYAIEGSETIVTNLKQRFPLLEDKLVIGDFTLDIPFEENFDLIVDRSSLTCNSTDAIKQCLDVVHQKLKNGGKYIGIDWFSTQHYEYKNGKSCEDVFTRTGYSEGLLEGVGRVHYSDKAHLLDLFRNFTVIILEHKIVKCEIPSQDVTRANWNFVMQKNQ